jgi:hypothetical protein
MVGLDLAWIAHASPDAQRTLLVHTVEHGSADYQQEQDNCVALYLYY